MFPSADTSACSPLPSSGFRGRPLREPCGSPPSQVVWAHKTARPSFPFASGFPWPTVPPLLRRRRGALFGSWEIPLEACPDLGTPATPVRPRISGRPNAAFRLTDSVGFATQPISELNLRGLLPCCVCFAPASRPARGNTRFWPVCSTLARQDFHLLDSDKKFHRLIFGSSSSKLFPAR